MFARDITEMGNIEYHYDYNDTSTSSPDANDTLIAYYCNPDYIIIDDPNYEDVDSLGFYIWDNGNSTDYSDKMGVSTISGFYFDRNDYLSSKQKKQFMVYFWIAIVGINISGLLLFFRSCALMKKDEYYKRYLVEIIIFDIISIILLSISVSLITPSSYSCTPALNEILEESLENTPINDYDVIESNGETLLILYGLIVIHCLFILFFIGLILRMKCKENKRKIVGFEDEDNEQYKKNSTISEGPGDGDGRTTTYDNPNLDPFTTTDV